MGDVINCGYQNLYLVADNLSLTYNLRLHFDALPQPEKRLPISIENMHPLNKRSPMKLSFEVWKNNALAQVLGQEFYLVGWNCLNYIASSPTLNRFFSSSIAKTFPELTLKYIHWLHWSEKREVRSKVIRRQINSLHRKLGMYELEEPIYWRMLG